MDEGVRVMQGATTELPSCRDIHELSDFVPPLLHGSRGSVAITRPVSKKEIASWSVMLYGVV